MGEDRGPTASTLTQAPALAQSWYSGLKGYHVWVVAVGVLSWSLCCMDQRIFILSRQPTLETVMAGELSGLEPADATALVNKRGNLATAAMIVGWSVGGLFFGVMGDRWGRVKTLCANILTYALFTGLSGMSQSWGDFCLYRFLTGCGVGGTFATSATLIAETVPSHSRTVALGLFQALSAAGNVLGSAIAAWMIQPGLPIFAGTFGQAGVPGWRAIFVIGMFPAVLVIPILLTVREPQAWLEAREKAKGQIGRQLGDIKGLFGEARWRRNTLVGLGLCVAGVIGLWGIGFWSPELVSEALKGAPPERVEYVRGVGTMVQDVGAFFGMLAFTVLATRIGRRATFGLSLILCWVVVSLVFAKLDSAFDAYWMLPLMGFATLTLFGGYAIYFPELFPTRLRSTGTSFCYNVGRVLAAVVMLFKIPMKDFFAGLELGGASMFRTVAIAMASVYLLALLILIWAPETKGKPLPTEDGE